MPSAPPVVLIALGILGCSLIGFVAGLGGVVTNEYVDYNLSGNPLVLEYDFRVGGKYGSITLSLLIAGSILAFAGNTIGLHMVYEGQHDKGLHNRRIMLEIVPTLMCPRCKRDIPMHSKFCPKCGMDIIK